MNNAKQIDVERLKASVNIIDVIGRHIHLEQRGAEHFGICPFHDDHKKSLQVNEAKQIFKCFACDVGGDAIDFFTEQGMEFKEALEAVNGGEVRPDSLQGGQREAKKPSGPREDIEQVIPAPSPARASDAKHPKFGAPDNVWKWHTAGGDLIGYTLRFNHKDGKDILPLTWQRGQVVRRGKAVQVDGWIYKGFQAPRPMYNLKELADNPKRPVLIVEGEKCVEAAKQLFPELVVSTWMGGARALEKTDWSALDGRPAVYLWPDHDKPGEEAMRDIAEMIKDTVPIVKGIKNPEDAPGHWDVADADWTPAEAQKYVKENVFTMYSARPDPEGPEEPPIREDDVPPADFDRDYNPDRPKYLPTENEHFKFLGFEKNDSGQQSFRFYVKRPKTTIRLTAAGMGKTTLTTLAPINWWETQFPRKNSFDMAAATNWLIQQSNAIGHFNDKLIRGRGAWRDEGRVVLHAGDILVVDGQPVELGDFDTRYIYESSESLDFKTQAPLKAAEARQMIELCKRLPWKRAVNAQLLAGWCVIAPICGVLPWRPHIWLTGATGTGKSWIFQNIVSRMIGETGYSVQSETTEAGIRQLLQHDALPVIFDEAEGEDRRAQERMSNVMSLMRSASTDDGGIMVKGTSGGTAKTYHIRSCFAFASINVQVSHQSDRTRVTVLEMDRPAEEGKQRRWRDFLRDYNALVTDEYIARVQARTIALIPVIFENAKTFAAAAAAHLGEQRQGDQLGALLAGAYALSSDKKISFDDALRWLERQDSKNDAWREERLLEGTRDEYMLFTHIMEQILRVESSYGPLSRTIGELVKMVIDTSSDPVVGGTAANESLMRIGVKVTDEGIYISNYADYIHKVLRDTAWAKNHNKVLLRIDGAEPVEGVKFASGTDHRAVRIPRSIMA